ncbi:MAG: TetR/AcrR family transcriptional regulator [Phycisphaeraceae bacterium]|nr:MAG: TetR/AcrR family transcriptional regulator [Phycisphaeraceae bacterium]
MQQTDTRERLIAAGLDLFYQQGFHATGLDQILAEVGTTKTTFYKYFESKEALALACIQRRDEGWRAKLPRLLRERGGDDPLDQLREVWGVWRDWFSDIAFNGCLFIHACSEFPNPNDDCHIAARANVNALREIVRGLAEAGGLDHPEEFARQFGLLMQGAIIYEVIDREGTAARTAAEVGEMLIERALIAGSAG